MCGLHGLVPTSGEDVSNIFRNMFTEKNGDVFNYPAVSRRIKWLWFQMCILQKGKLLSFAEVSVVFIIIIIVESNAG